MPLSVRARVEIYIPDLPQPVYQKMLEIFAEEFITVFGVCSITRGFDDKYFQNVESKLLSNKKFIAALAGRFKKSA